MSDEELDFYFARFVAEVRKQDGQKYPVKTIYEMIGSIQAYLHFEYIDDFKDGTHNCSQNANCTNTDGAFNCTCIDGYRADGVTCKDIDECKNGTHNCSQNANCTNTGGAFNCTCLDGYRGDGVTRKDIDECKNGTHNCSPNANCTNTDGAFNCTCIDGYHGDGVTCKDIDECKDGTHNCSQNDNCTNTDGSFNCTRFDGFCEDGVTYRCEKLNGISKVCFQGRQNQPGKFTPDTTGFLVAVKLVYRHGKIRCGGGAKYESYWGCKGWTTNAKHPLNIFVTNEEKKVLFPLTGFSWSGDSHLNKLKWYSIDGFNSISPTLVLQRREPYYISRQSILHMWYGEDLVNEYEGNNTGRICADVYGYFI